MKSKEEIEMERAYAEVRRLESLLDAARDKADIAWKAYVHRPDEMHPSAHCEADFYGAYDR